VEAACVAAAAATPAVASASSVCSNTGFMRFSLRDEEK
jgi:hypothetical protein